MARVELALASALAAWTKPRTISTGTTLDTLPAGLHQLYYDHPENPTSRSGFMWVIDGTGYASQILVVVCSTQFTVMCRSRTTADWNPWQTL